MEFNLCTMCGKETGLPSWKRCRDCSRPKTNRTNNKKGGVSYYTPSAEGLKITYVEQNLPTPRGCYKARHHLRNFFAGGLKELIGLNVVYVYDADNPNVGIIGHCIIKARPPKSSL